MIKRGLEYRPDSYVLTENEIYLIYPDIVDDQITSNVVLIQLTSKKETKLQSTDIDEVRFASCSLDLFFNKNDLGWSECSGFPVLYRYADGQVVQIYNMSDSPKADNKVVNLTEDGAIAVAQPEFESGEPTTYWFMQLN